MNDIDRKEIEQQIRQAFEEGNTKALSAILEKADFRGLLPNADSFSQLNSIRSAIQRSHLDDQNVKKLFGSFYAAPEIGQHSSDVPPEVSAKIIEHIFESGAKKKDYLEPLSKAIFQCREDRRAKIMGFISKPEIIQELNAEVEKLQMQKKLSEETQENSTQKP